MYFFFPFGEGAHIPLIKLKAGAVFPLRSFEFLVGPGCQIYSQACSDSSCCRDLLQLK